MNEDKFETMELALKDQSEELVKINQQIRDLITIATLLRNEVGGFAEKLNVQNITVEADTRPIQKIIDSAFLNMSLMIEKVLAKVRSSFWQLFFQSNGLKWTVILIVLIALLTFSYRLIWHGMER